MEQRLPGSTESSSAGTYRAATLWEQIQLFFWNTMSSGFSGAQRAALLEHMEHLLPLSTENTSSGAAATWEHREQLRWSTLSSTSRGADTTDRGSTAACTPAELLPARGEVAAPCAPVEQLYLLPESHCSRAPAELLSLLPSSLYSTGAAMFSDEASAPCAPTEHLYL